MNDSQNIYITVKHFIPVNFTILINFTRVLFLSHLSTLTRMSYSCIPFIREFAWRVERVIFLRIVH